MKREIKFRQPVFERTGSFREWHYWGAGLIEGGEVANVGWLSFSLGIADPKDSQQFTGLKDKNGKEIYEGDILLDSISAVRWVVKFGHNKKIGFTGWYVECEGIDRTAALNGDYSGDKNSYVEIIGNIYENPELLNSEQEDAVSDTTKMPKEQNDDNKGSFGFTA